MTSHRLLLAVAMFGCLVLGGTRLAAMPAPDGIEGAPLTAGGPGLVRLAQAQPAQTPDAQDPAAAAPADQPNPADEPIGNVASLTGVATVVRNNAATPLQVKDDIYLNDVVETQASSSLGITFNDATTFRLSANAQITIDNYVYEENGSNNAGAFDIAKGTVAFVAAAVAKTGNMQITTPSATLGIRGTTGVIEVPENATATNNVNIKLYPDADGRVGRIELNDRQGARLGLLTQAASGFSIRPGAGGGRFAAVALTISPQQQQRDQGFVRQVHATQTAGRRIVTEQRAFRRANPGLNNRNNPARPGQPQQPNQNRPGQPGQPGQQNRPGQPPQPGTPNNRQGQQQRPGTPGQPGTPPRAGQNATPATPTQPGTTARPGPKVAPTTSPQPGTSPRPGQNALPATPAQPGTPPRSGQPGTPPNIAPRTQPTAPPLPNGQPLLRQGGPKFAPGVPRPGLLNRPGVPRPRQAPPPKDKKKQ